MYDEVKSFPLSFEEFERRGGVSGLSAAELAFGLYVLEEYLTSSTLLEPEINWTLAVTRTLAKLRRKEEEKEVRKQELIGFLKELGVEMPLLEEK